MMTQHKPHIINPRAGHQHSHTIIFLHGRDSNAQDFASELFESEASGPPDQPRTLPDLLPTVKWVFPAAPILRSARFDTDMSQWFDMWSVEDPHEQPAIQEEGLQRSVAAILDVVRSEEVHVQREKIFLAGISQGFATVVAALFTGGLRGFAGLIGLCSWMPYGGPDELIQLFGTALERGAAYTQSCMVPTPILLCQSSDDDVVPVENGRVLRDELEKLQDVEVEWRECQDGGHWVNEPQGIDDLVGFLRKHMKP
ncbi:unnamed protein product [Discula destructiva]